MAGTKGEEGIVEGHEEIGGRKRVNGNKDARPTKRAKVEGNKDADCRNLVDKEEGEAVGDGTEGGEEEELKKKKDRLCRLLEDDPKKLKNSEVEDVIWYLDVDQIISLALKSDKEKGMRDYSYLDNESFVPSSEKVLGLLRLMLQWGGMEKLKEVDLFILYQSFPRLSFAQLLLSALDSYIKRLGRGGALFDEADRRVICGLCYALPWKLFTRVMYHKTSLPQFKRSGEEEDLDEECTDVGKKAAESCEICNGKGKHSGVYGYHCSFWESVPSGLTVGPSHLIICWACRGTSTYDSNDFVRCCYCGFKTGQAVPRSALWNI